MSFKDHFSALATGYASFRPVYPDALYAWLAQQTPGRTLAWDCAAGSGQAAIGLAEHFDQVIATDASAGQIENAYRHARVRYAVAPAEDSGLAARSVDLVSVAQALHWFDLERFYAEVRRVLRPDGLLAVWTYNLFRTDIDALDTLVDHLYGEVLGPWWPSERRLVENGYRDLPFPFTEITVPAFEMRTEWDLAHLLGYLRTWSAVKRYREACGVDPVQAMADALGAASGAHQRLSVRWPLALRVGRCAP
ncbi:MAG: class I SAM-dependent methyltransferase [Thiohalomonadaceae bacterium]